MAYERKPIYHFDSVNSVGINKIPNEVIIFVKNTSKLYEKLTDTGLTNTSTIRNAIDNNNISVVSGGSSTQASIYEYVYADSNYTAEDNQVIVCETEGSALPEGSYALTVTLPANPEDGSMVFLVDGAGNAQDRSVLVTRNGNKIDGENDDITCDVNYFDIRLVFNSTSNNWALGGK